MRVLIKYFRQDGFSWLGHFMRRGRILKTLAVSVTGTCFEERFLGGTLWVLGC